MEGLLPCNYGQLLGVLNVHQAEVIQFLRCWRSDDLDVDTAPDFLPEVLRRVVKRVVTDWADRKCRNLQAKPRLLTSFFDPAVGHDGNSMKERARWRSAAGTSSLLRGRLTGTCAPLRQYAVRPRA